MKIPQTVKIGGIVYDVRYEERLNNGTEMAYGHIDFEKALIRLGADMQSAQGQCQTLLHEIIHGIDEHYGLELSEEVVDKIANGLHMVIVDNSDMFTE